MGSSLNPARRFDADTAASLAPRLEAFAAGLPPGEQAILVAMVQRAMPPLDRMALHEPGEVLNEDELRALNELLALGEKAR